MNEIILEIISILRTQLTTTYKKYYFGEIKVPNQAFLPFIEVFPVSTNIQNRGTGGMANNTFSVGVRIKNTLKKYLQENTNVETLSHVQDLVKKMEERNTDGTFKTNTILGILHNNLQLNGKANINGDWNIVYDELDLGDSYITFATVTFSVNNITN